MEWYWALATLVGTVPEQTQLPGRILDDSLEEVLGQIECVQLQASSLHVLVQLAAVRELCPGGDAPTRPKYLDVESCHEGLYLLALEVATLGRE